MMDLWITGTMPAAGVKCRLEKSQKSLPFTINGVPVSSVITRRGRPAVLTAEEKAKRKRQGYADRQLMLHIGWNEVVLARRSGMSLTSLRRALAGEAPPIKNEIREWMQGMSDYLKEHPCPRVRPFLVGVDEDTAAKNE